MALKKTLKRLEIGGKNALRSILAPRAIRALRDAASRVTSLEEAVALASSFNYRHIRLDPSQIHSEILQLLNLLALNPPKTVLEIGTYRGGTFFLFSRVAAPDALLISLDLPPNRDGLGYPPWRRELFRSFAREQQEIRLVLADSHQQATVKQIKGLLAGRQLDFLFIDGDHTYAGVKSDYEMFSPLIGAGGIIAFHDIVPRSPDRACGVPQFWQELKKERTTIDFVADWGQDGFGIGIVRVG